MISAQTRNRLLLAALAAFAGAHLIASPVFAARSIDYVATAISPPADFNGQSGNFNLVDNVSGGSVINFTLTFSIGTGGGSTSYPNTKIFSVQNVTKPDGVSDPVVTFGPVPGTDSYTGTFGDVNTQLTTAVRITAPDMPGAYSVRIRASHSSPEDGGGLNLGGGISVNFTVYNPCAQADTALTLTVNPNCVLLGATSVLFTATLTSDDEPVPYKTIDFTVAGDPAGSVDTDSNGVASVEYDPSGLAVGDYTVQASFQGDDCDYNSSGTSANLAVIYSFLGFQPPVEIGGAGVGLFSGHVIPVKIKIADAFGMPVPDAEARVYFRQTSANVDYYEGEPLANTNADSGNLMRYDPTEDQYIFNWDISKLDNGDYAIRIGLDEGECAEEHVATVSITSKGGKKK